MTANTKLRFLVRTLITYVKTNAAGNPEKEKKEVVFELDDKSAKMPWYALWNFLVPQYLTSLLGPQEVAWDRIYEIKILKQIDRFSPEDVSNIPIRVMTLDQLEAYCAKWELNVPVSEFFSVEKAREMVMLRIEDEKGYKRHYAEYKEGKHRAYPELDALRQRTQASTVPVEEFDSLDMKKPSSKSARPGTRKAGTVALKDLSKKEQDAMNEGVDTAEDEDGKKDPFEGV